MYRLRKENHPLRAEANEFIQIILRAIRAHHLLCRGKARMSEVQIFILAGIVTAAFAIAYHLAIYFGKK